MVGSRYQGCALPLPTAALGQHGQWHELDSHNLFTGPKPMPEELMWKGCNFTSLVADLSWFQTLWIHGKHPSRQRAPAVWQ